MKIEELDQRIEKSFKAEPDFQLPADFAVKVVSRVVRHEQWKTDLLEYLSIAGVLILVLAVVSGTYYFANKEFLLKIYSVVADNIIPVVLILALLNFIFLADRVLLRLLFNRWHRT